MRAMAIKISSTLFTIGARVKKNAAELGAPYGFAHGAVFRRLVARR